MASFWSIARNEARQLWRGRAFWIIQVLLLLNAPLAVFGSPAPGALALPYLVIPILVGPALLDFGDSCEVVWSSPTDALNHYAGTLAGLWLGLLPGSLMQLAGWFVVSQVIPNDFTPWIWLISLTFLLLGNTVGLGLVALLAMLVRRLAPLLILWTVGWLWLFMDGIFLPMLGESSKPMQANVFSNIFFHNLKFSPSLGLGLALGKVVGMAAWFLGLALLATALGLGAALLIDRRRSVRRPLIVPALIVVGMLAAGGGYALNARAASETAVRSSPYDPQIDTWQVDRRQADVEVNASTGVIAGTSRLTLRPVRPVAKPELVLRLNPGLELEYARDRQGAELPARRVGDSVVLSLPAIPAGPVELDLAWQGRMQFSYLSFEQRWGFSDFPDEIPYYTMPVPVRALVIPEGGYVLRDGDWMPGPWMTSPYQALDGRLTLHPVGGEAVAAKPAQDGAVTWEGELPKALVAFLPGRKIEGDEATAVGSTPSTPVIAVSPRAGSQQIERAELVAAAVTKLAPRLGEALPRYVVMAPYLNEPVWSGDLLLVPDGSGFYLSPSINWLYFYDLNDQQQPRLERLADYMVARLWVQGQFSPPPLPFRPRITPPGKEPQVVSIADVSEERWSQEGGHWIQLAEALDVTNEWTPVTKYILNVGGEQSVLAFWLTMELADEVSRQADLDLLDYFVSVYQQLQGHSERYGMISDLLWPDVLLARAGREQVNDLHAWAEAVGREKAVDIAIEVLRRAEVWNREQILAGLERLSGVPVGEGRQ